MFQSVIYKKNCLNITENKSECKDGSKEEIQIPCSYGFENTGAIPKVKSVKDGKIYYLFNDLYFIRVKLFLSIYI